MNWKKVDRYTRAGAYGRTIKAPCGYERRVYHFSWTALGCPGCSEMHDKPHFLVKVVK